MRRSPGIIVALLSSILVAHPVVARAETVVAMAPDADGQDQFVLCTDSPENSSIEDSRAKSDVAPGMKNCSTLTFEETEDSILSRPVDPRGSCQDLMWLIGRGETGLPCREYVLRCAGKPMRDAPDALAYPQVSCP